VRKDGSTSEREVAKRLGRVVLPVLVIAVIVLAVLILRTR